MHESLHHVPDGIRKSIGRSRLLPRVEFRSSTEPLGRTFHWNIFPCRGCATASPAKKFGTLKAYRCYGFLCGKVLMILGSHFVSFIHAIKFL
uniref:Uncharacterized protein n=1 Tax=Setaria italica TaxID=4555 RepID=K3Y0D1_SETIT